MGEIYMNTFVCLCDQWRTMGEIFMNTFVCLCDQWRTMGEIFMNTFVCLCDQCKQGNTIILMGTIFFSHKLYSMQDTVAY